MSTKISPKMRSEWEIKYREMQRAAKARVQEILNDPNFEPLDEDGYPTDQALEVVETWDCDDLKDWFAFIKSIWYLSSWGWHEGEAPDEYNKDKTVYLYAISTAGWSGNEGVIRAMQNNKSYCWDFSWVSSRRGGHYTFEVKPERDEEVDEQSHS